MPVQTKRGYLKGVHGVLIKALNVDGTPKSPTDSLWVNTPQEATVEAEILEGEVAQLRGGDRLLTEVREDDVLTSVTVTFSNARFSAKLVQLVDGGILILEGPDYVGYDAPSKEAQGEGRPIFWAEIYVRNFSAKGVADQFGKLTLPYCKGHAVAILSASDREWSIPTFSMRGMENPLGGTGGIPAGPYRKEFVATAPSAPED